MSTEDHPDWWRPVGGQNSQDSTLERRSLIWNDNNVLDGVDPPASYEEVVYKSKFFTRGCRGMLEDLQIYCIRTAAGHLRLRYSPHPCIGPFGEVIIIPGATWAWRPAHVEQMWNYDSLFIWVHRCDDDVSWAYDAVQPYDGHWSQDAGASWEDMAIRPFIRAVYTGETPGDVPVSGIVNTIEIPSVGTQATSEAAVNVPNAIVTHICTFEGAGTMLSAALEFDTSVTPTGGTLPGAVVYEIHILVDPAFALRTSNRHLTQSCVATSGQAPHGAFYQCTVADPAWDETVMYIFTPLKFRRRIMLYAYQSTGAAVDVTGILYLNALV